MTAMPQRRTSHPYHMYDCIQDQPSAISQVLESQTGTAGKLAQQISNATRVHISGIGTSWHAALVGEYLLRNVGKYNDVKAWHSFEFCTYPPELSGNDLVIVMSHRGTKHYSRQALALAKESGAVTALITGRESKADQKLADVIMETSYQDRSAAFTISHTAAMTALAMAAVRVRGDGAVSEYEALHKLPETIQSALDLEPQVQDIVMNYRNRDWYCFTGWGPNTATAYETALKINEATYDITTAYQLEQLLHGPFVATTSRCLVTFIAPPGTGYKRAVEIAKAVKETGAHVLALAQEGDTEVSNISHARLALPEVPEFLTPIVYLAPLQLFTYWLALDRWRNPDLFRLDDPRHQAARKHYSL